MESLLIGFAILLLIIAAPTALISAVILIRSVISYGYGRRNKGDTRWSAPRNKRD